MYNFATQRDIVLFRLQFIFFNRTKYITDYEKDILILRCFVRGDRGR